MNLHIIIKGVQLKLRHFNAKKCLKSSSSDEASPRPGLNVIISIHSTLYTFFGHTKCVILRRRCMLAAVVRTKSYDLCNLIVCVCSYILDLMYCFILNN